MTSSHIDICSALDRHAVERPDTLALRFLHDGEADGAATVLTFAALRAHALGVAAALQQRLAPGDRAILLYEGGIDFVTAFLGCLYAGIIAVPAYPPDPRRVQRTLPRLRAIVEDARAKLVLASADILHVAAPICAQADGLRDLIWLGPGAIEQGAAEPHAHPALPSDVAFLQYTSGSTGDPKGVMITRDNLAWSCADLCTRLAYDDACHQVSWLPAFHDFGLVWGLMSPIYGGVPVTFMLPTAFLQRPARWFEAITRFAGTHTAAPNFAFDVATAKIGSDVLQRLDLSSLRLITNSSEPIRASTIEAFTRTFGPAGLRAEAMCTAFGMAEATLKVTLGQMGIQPTLLQVSSRALEENRVQLADTGADARVLVGCGQAGPEPSVAIVDVETSRRLGEDLIGEIWIRGRGIGQGYWGRPEASAEAFGNRIDGEADTLWLRTGDLGFISREELFIVGRIKDMLIVRGRNLHPQDIELVAERAHPAVRGGCVAVFALDVEGDERAALVAEVDPARLGGDSPEELLRKLRVAIAEEADVQMHDLALIQPRSLFKTSSGKIQRRRTRAALEAGELPVVARWTAPPQTPLPLTPSPYEGEGEKISDFPLSAEHRDGERGPGGEASGGEASDLERRIWGWLSESLTLPDAPLRDVPFRELGLESTSAVGLSGRIAEALGRPMPPDLLFEHSTLGALVAHLMGVPVPAQAARDERPFQAALATASDTTARIELLAPHLERQLLRALGRDQLDPDQPLSEIGLDDVLAAELCLRMARDLGLRVFPREMLGCGTFRDFVRFAADITAPYRPTAERLTLTEIDRRVTSHYDVGSLAGNETLSADPMLFILSPPRSGSTLLRVMLAGHSRLFSPQELYLGCFSDMAAHDRHLGGTVLNMGVISTIAELLSRTGAWNLYTQWKQGAVSTAEVYSFFSSRLGGRTLVDKSPYFFPPQTVIRRLASLFPHARFVHLVRHPVSCISSYVRERFHGIFPETRGIDPYDCGEWVWTRVQEGILEIEAELGPGRMHRLYFEDLIGDSERTFRRLCPSLGLSFEPALLTPYSGHRMVAGGFQIGDPNFARYKSINADKAEAWRNEVLPHVLREETLAIAERLGYDPKTLANDRRPGPITRHKEALPVVDTAMGGIDLERDAALPLSVVPNVTASPWSGAPRSIFLTGATGFLGAFLLDTLLQRTEAIIHCLVRAGDDERAGQRLRGNLERYGLWREEYGKRLRPVPGDVSAPRLGMPLAQYAALGQEVDVILHGASQISWLEPYRNLFASNVEGTRRLLQFAAEGRVVPVHYVSSLGATLIRPFENTRMVDEVTARSGLGTESILELPLGYLETKWVTNRMIEEARRRGLPVALYAPGLITGHSQTGIDSLSKSQFIHALIKGSVQLGCFPDGLGWRFIPVDVVARDIVSCLLSPASINQNIYLDSTSLLSPEVMVDTLRRFGFDVRVVPYAAWRRKVLDLARTADTKNALFPFTDVIYALTPLRFLGQRYQFEWCLENRGCPEEIRAMLEPREHIQPSVVSQLVDYYIRAGAMPTPAPSTTTVVGR